ncbi:MAG: asparagine synthase (glutamine-hydrolyzing) [Gammaproteobacteria bacterium]|nr:asparagine synthase (glutamine-hydrolyzing) [Gammaproteobacteria bacterium]
MCGIAGFAGIGLPAEEAPARLRAMCDAIRHRGPDSDGYFVRDEVAMGMRRLSIIDVAGGAQPISNEDGTVTVVFNGEIYNHHELRRELLAAGHQFTTRSDTEVLVHLYEAHGPEMVRRLHGMFAFSIWDSRRQRLLLARDRTGMKPLSYALRGEGIVWCSELRSLYAFDRSMLRVAPGAVMEYLAFGYVPDPNSIFEGVAKLPAGHFLIWSPGRDVHVQRYWRPPLTDASLCDETQIVEELRRRLEAAVTSHLESEVPLGAFLSGGTDSSMVVAMMCRHAAGRVKTFSIGFAEAEYDESQAARAVAAQLGTEHTELVVRPDVEQIFESVAAMFDEPFADSSAIPTFLVAQLARQSVTVALSGDGGDELFGGYTRYGETLRRGGGARGAGSRFIGALGLMLPHAFPGRNRLVDLGRSRLGRYASSVVQPVRVDEGGIASAWHPAARRTIDEQLYRFTSADESADFAALMMRLDFETYLAGDILTKVDRTSMAVSLEARVPLLDFDLVDFALRIPGELRVTPAESKRLYRRAINGIVPDFVLSAPKRGFAVPLAQWFRGSLRHRIQALRHPSTALEQYLDGRAVERLIGEHSIGRRDHSVLLWRLMVLNYWLAAFADGRLGRPPLVPPFSATETRARPGRQARVSKSAPPRVSNLFLHDPGSRPRLRVALLVDAEGIPAYARGVIEDLCRADYVDIAFVAVNAAAAAGGPTRDGVALRAYASLVESRYQLHPDPLELVDCDDLLAGVPQLAWPPAGAVSGGDQEVDSPVQSPLDVILDFGGRPARQLSPTAARHGVWRYHFGDRRLYPLGSGFLREIIDGAPLTGIELVRLGAHADDDVTLMRTLFRTVPFPSRQANRFAPVWGSRHFVIQSLWTLRQAPAPHLPHPELHAHAGSAAAGRTPTVAQFGRWMVGELGSRAFPLFRRVDRPLHWQIALRRTRRPLYEDASRAALQSFRWIESPPDRHWADPTIFEHDGEAWLFFEEMIDPSRVGHICCGRLTEEGHLIELRAVLQQPHHLSFPQIIAAAGAIFMLPESAQGGGVDLYRATRFPDEWVFEKRLLDFRCVDSSIFQAAGCWWMITSPQVVPGNNAITWLLRADRLTGPWHFQPGGIVASDVRIARGAGAVFDGAGRLIRPSQDCSVSYGYALNLNEIVSLGGGGYRERPICRVDPGWMSGLKGVHSYSRVGEWEAIDGGFLISA